MLYHPTTTIRGPDPARRDDRDAATGRAKWLLVAASYGIMAGASPAAAAPAGTPKVGEAYPQSPVAPAQMSARLDGQQCNKLARGGGGDGEIPFPHPAHECAEGVYITAAPASVATAPAREARSSRSELVAGRPMNLQPVTPTVPGAASAPNPSTNQAAASPATTATTKQTAVQLLPDADVPAAVGPDGTGGVVPVDRQDAQAAVAPSLKLTTSTQRQAYAVGVTVWQEVVTSLDAQLTVADIELDPQLVLAGIQDMANGRSLRMSREAIDTVMTTLNQLFHERNEAYRAQNESEGRAYRIAFSREKGAKSDAGAWYQVVTPGKSKRLRASDVVELSVTGSLPDGTTFDPSGQNGQTKTAKVSALLPAVAIGLQKVSVGGHIKVVVPPEKGYGEQGLPPSIPGGATLIFDIHVLRLADW